MIGNIIEWSVRNIILVLIGTAFLTMAGLYAVWTTPLDAIPDLSDTQVIVYTEFSGQAPQVVEDLSAHHVSAQCAKIKGRARVFVLWRIVHLHYF
jgi:Cu/Ag efflux pump CusA